MKKVILYLSILILSINAYAQIPTGYYNNAQGKTGEDLKTALFNIIKNHSSKSYSSLHTHYQNTDKKSNGEVWDMYSDKPGNTPSYTYNFVSADKCGNYGQEGDCYNREHSFPQSWFSSASPMQTDLFQVYPTDGYVNGKRSSFPFGEVASATWTSTNGSKLGSSATNGYNGKVFEPIDEYKGDFARTYFYMVTRYKDKTSSWNAPVLTGSNLQQWAIDLFVKWDNQDPVSTKEINRNNAVHDIQNNRNPYIDKPEYVANIWGDAEPNTNTNSIANLSIKLKFVKITYSNNTLNIKNIKGFDNIKVMSILGNELSSFQVNSANEEISLNLKSGIYIAVLDGFGIKFIVK